MPTITVIPTITTSAYSSGDVVGGKLTISGAIGQRILLTHITVFDDDGEGAQLDFFFFKDDLTGTSGYTDNAAFAINASDKANCVGCASVLASSYLAAGSDSVATQSPINLLIDRGEGGNEHLYAIAVIRSTTTYTAATDLRFSFGWLIDF